VHVANARRSDEANPAGERENGGRDQDVPRRARDGVIARASGFECPEPGEQEQTDRQRIVRRARLTHGDQRSEQQDQRAPAARADDQKSSSGAQHHGRRETRPALAQGCALRIVQNDGCREPGRAAHGARDELAARIELPAWSDQREGRGRERDQRRQLPGVAAAAQRAHAHQQRQQRNEARHHSKSA
jgi:hypothetical protein